MRQKSVWEERAESKGAIPAFGGKLGKIYARFYGNIKGISVFSK